MWWQIRDILVAKKTPFVFLENVDRSTKSPAKQRCRDFGIMLRCLSDLGYAVEWRIINAADYGFPQRRRRTYIFAYRKGTSFYKEITKKTVNEVLKADGIFSRAFPIVDEELKISESNLKQYDDLADFSDNYKFTFENSGYMFNGKVYTAKTIPVVVNPVTLGDIAQGNVDEHFYLNETDGAISFDKVCFWNAPNKVVDGPIKKMHEECAILVRKGEAFYYDEKGKLKDKFPKEDRNSNGVCHVRPHARRGIDHYELPIADKETGITSYTKQSFWFNKVFVERMIKDSEK